MSGDLVDVVNQLIENHLAAFHADVEDHIMNGNNSNANALKKVVDQITTPYETATEAALADQYAESKGIGPYTAGYDPFGILNALVEALHTPMEPAKLEPYGIPLQVVGHDKAELSPDHGWVMYYSPEAKQLLKATVTEIKTGYEPISVETAAVPHKKTSALERKAIDVAEQIADMVRHACPGGQVKYLVDHKIDMDVFVVTLTLYPSAVDAPRKSELMLSTLGLTQAIDPQVLVSRWLDLVLLQLGLKPRPADAAGCPF